MGHGATAGPANTAARGARRRRRAATVAATLQALATPCRLLILARLREGPCPVTELAAAVGMEQSAVSHQLRLLRNLGLVDRRPRRGRSDRLRPVRQPRRRAARRGRLPQSSTCASGSRQARRARLRTRHVSRPALSTPPATPGWSPWRAVVGFGVVSLAADMVYEGARSVTGPLLARSAPPPCWSGSSPARARPWPWCCGWSSARRVDRTGATGRMTLVGYALTAVCVPALAADAVPRRRRAGRGLRAGARRAHRQGGAQPGEVDAARPRRRPGRPRPRVRRAQGAGPGGRVRRPAAGGRDRRADRRAVAGDGRARGPGAAAIVAPALGPPPASATRWRERGARPVGAPARDARAHRRGDLPRAVLDVRRRPPASPRPAWSPSA